MLLKRGDNNESVKKLQVRLGLEAIGNPSKIAILTPYWPPADEMIANFFNSSGYEVTNTYVTDTNEGRVQVNLKYTESVEVNGEFVNSVYTIAEFNFGVGSEIPSLAARFDTPCISA